MMIFGQQSIRSRLVYQFLKYRNFRAHLNVPLKKQRAELEHSACYLLMPSQVNVRRITVDNIPTEWLKPIDAKQDKAILYLHGGAFTMGSCNTHRVLASRFALASNTPVLLPEFRLAPEFPFPASLEDCVNVYYGLINNGFSPKKIDIVGDSSGGNLALVLSELLGNFIIPLPAALVCLLPWVDLSLSRDSLITLAKLDPICNLDICRYHAGLYAGEKDKRLPLVSQVFAELQGFPPILIQVGTKDIFLSDAIRLKDRASKEEVDVTFEIWDGMWHVWHIFAAFVPEAQRAIDKAGAFIRKHID